jgi:linoleoyl-CoA desaturase
VGNGKRFFAHYKIPTRRIGKKTKNFCHARVDYYVDNQNNLLHLYFRDPYVATSSVLLASSYWLFVMHYIAGFILAMIFQPAHVIEGTEYPLPDENGNLENSWAIHQLHTTTNFGHKEKLFSWYVGGLNYQVEHHLFPTSATCIIAIWQRL